MNDSLNLLLESRGKQFVENSSRICLLYVLSFCGLSMSKGLLLILILLVVLAYYLLTILILMVHPSGQKLQFWLMSL